MNFNFLGGPIREDESGDVWGSPVMAVAYAHELGPESVKALKKAMGAKVYKKAFREWKLHERNIAAKDN